MQDAYQIMITLQLHAHNGRTNFCSTTRALCATHIGDHVYYVSGRVTHWPWYSWGTMSWSCNSLECKIFRSMRTVLKYEWYSSNYSHPFICRYQEQIYTGTDITMLLREIKRAQDVHQQDRRDEARHDGRCARQYPEWGTWQGDKAPPFTSKHLNSCAMGHWIMHFVWWSHAVVIQISVQWD